MGFYVLGLDVFGRYIARDDRDHWVQITHIHTYSYIYSKLS